MGIVLNNSLYAGEVGEVILVNFFSWSEKSEILFITIDEIKKIVGLVGEIGEVGEVLNLKYYLIDVIKGNFRKVYRKIIELVGLVGEVH